MSALTQLLSGKTLLIFDLDGTLIDTTPIHARAFGETFARLNILVDYSKIAGMKTENAVTKVLAEAGVRASPKLVTELTAEKRQRALKLAKSARPLDGAVEFVLRATRRFRVALCTSASRPATQDSLGALELAGAFDPIITGEDVDAGKPDPASYLEVLRRAAVHPGAALVFEDSDLGAQAARRAGITVVRIDHGWADPIKALRELCL